MNAIGGFATSKFPPQPLSAGGLKPSPEPDQKTKNLVKSAQHANSSNLVGTIALTCSAIGCAGIATVMGLLAFGAYKVIKSPLTYLGLFVSWLAKRFIK